MALKRKGDDPIIVKTKREAYKPNVENQKKLAAYESAVSKNKAIEDKYKSDVETYGKQMKAYSEQPKGRRDMTTFFQGGGRYLNPQELEAFNKGNAEDVSRRGGLKASKVYVSKDYGKEGVSMGYSGYKGAYHEWLDKPTAPVKQKTPTVERPKLAIEQMPLNKVTGVSTKKKQLAVPNEKEKWQAPGRNLVSVEKTFTTRGGKEKTRTPISKAVENVKRKAQYKQELKQGKAYFGGFEGESASDIASTKSSLKKQIKDVKKGTVAPMESVSKRERLKGYKSELKQANQAEKYAKKVGAEYYGVGAGQNVEFNPKFGSKVRFATPETFKGYRPSTDNPANRNTIISQEKKIKK
jgi:hypothetical protein